MANSDELEYCRVDVKTGDILEGPMPLPQNWGSVVGFNNLSPAAVRRYGWFPVSLNTVPRPYGLMFLPERGIIMKVPHKGVIAGRMQYAAAVMHQLADTYAQRPFYSDVMGDRYRFSNSYISQIHRLNCLQVKCHCKCQAENSDGHFEMISVPYQVIHRLIEDSTTAYGRVFDRLQVGLEGIATSTDKEIAALIDTQFVDYFDD